MLGLHDRLGYARHSRRFITGDLDVDLRGKRALVTGASSGIGLATAELLVGHGAQVALLCRDQRRGEAALAQLLAAVPSARVELRRLDVASRADVRRFCDEEPGPVDYLVHNAGVYSRTRVVTDEGLELTYATHVAGPHLMTALLAPRLEAGARVVFVSSDLAYRARLSLRDLDWSARRYDGGAAYAQTKRMQLVLAATWAQRLSPRAHVYAMHPGWVDTPLVRGTSPTFARITRPILRTPAEGADTVFWLLGRRQPVTPSGGFFFDRKHVRAHHLPWTRERPEDINDLLARLDRPLDAT